MEEKMSLNRIFSLERFKNYTVSIVDHSETVEIARKTSFEFTFAVCGLDTAEEGVPFCNASI